MPVLICWPAARGNLKADALAQIAVNFALHPPMPYSFFVELHNAGSCKKFQLCYNKVNNSFVDEYVMAIIIIDFPVHKFYDQYAVHNMIVQLKELMLYMTIETILFADTHKHRICSCYSNDFSFQTHHNRKAVITQHSY